MNPRTRRKLIRSFVGSVLQSELTMSELKEVVSDIELENLSYDFSAILRDVIFILDERLQSKGKSWDYGSKEKIFMETINRRRIPKRLVIQLIKKINPRRSSGLNGDFTTREIIQKFSDTASMEELESLLRLLQGDESDDAYLKGIVRR